MSVALAALATALIVARAGSATPPPVEMKLACALNSNGLMRYVSSLNQCKKSETGVTIHPGPITVCVNPDGTVRKIPPYQCNKTGVVLTLPPASGTVYFCASNANGQLRFVTSPSQCAATEFAVFLIPNNRPPVAVADSYSTNEDTPLTVASPGVLANDTDADGDPLTAVLVSGPSHAASFTLNADGSFSYTPAADYNGSDSFTYRDNDSHANGNTVTVTLTISAVNDAPVNNLPSSQSLNQDSSLVLSSGNGNHLSVSDVDAGADPGFEAQLSVSHGTLTLSQTTGLTVTGNGTASVDLTGTLANADAALNGLTYTPTSGYFGPEALAITSNDHGATGSGGAKTDSDTLSITVNHVNHPPVATGDSYSTNEDTPLSVSAPGVLANDTDIDGDPIHAVLVSGPSHAAPSGFTLNADGSFSYTPEANYNGSDSFTYRANDGTADSNVATVTLTVNPVNDAPVANNDAASTSEDTPLSGSGVLANDTDVENDTLAAILVSGPSHAASFTLNSDGTYSYTPASNFNGTDSFTYKANDGALDSNVATVTLTVNAVNDAPVNSVPGAQSVGEGGSLVLSSGNGDLLSVSDVDVGSDPGFETQLSASHGALTLATTSGLAVTGNGTGSVDLTGTLADVNAALDGLTYAPTAGYSGPDSLGITSNDHGATGSGGALTDTDSVGITVNGTNQPPVNHLPAAQSTDEDTPLTLSSGNANAISISDPDAGSGGMKETLGVSHGTLSLNGTNGLTFSTGDGTNDASMVFTGTISDINTALDGLTYTPDANYNGPDSLSMTTDDQGNSGPGGPMSASDSLDLTINAVNDAPVLTLPAATVTANENQDTPITGISVSDIDAGSAPIVMSLTALDGTLNISTTVPGGVTSGEVIYDQIHQTAEMTASQDQINATLADPNGLIYNSGPNNLLGQQISVGVDDQGNTGSGGAKNDNGMVFVNVVVPPPVANNDSYTSTPVFGNTAFGVGTTPAGPHISITGSVLTNDSDPSGETFTADAGSITSTQGGSVTLNSDGTFTYLPPAGFQGIDTFQYTITNTDGTTSAPATVRLLVANMVWYVNNALPSNGDGRSSSPFNSLGSVNAPGGVGDVDGPGDWIFLYSSANPYTGGLPLESGQSLFGEPQGLNDGNGDQLVAAGGTNPTITNASGDGLVLAPNVSVFAVTSSGSSGSGISGTGDLDGAAVSSNVDVSGNSGPEVSLSGGSSGTVAIAASIENGSSGGTVAISSRSGGEVDLNGAITDAGGKGILLSSNGGTTINFPGGLTLSSGATAAFAATGGGTVNVTGSSNTLATTTGTALDVENTNIGSSGLTFQSISAGTGSGSSGNGILLSNTGTSGGLTVTGSGTAGSGGTIQHKTGGDGTTAGIGIYLNSTSGVSLARMQLNDFDNFAIRGTSVNGFTLSNSTINGTNGTSAANDEASLAIDNLSGSASITNDTITGGFEDDARIKNTTGSLSSLSITGSTFATANLATANDALSLIGQTGVTLFNASVTGDTFTRAQGDLYQYTLNTGSGTMHFDNNTVTNNYSATATLPAGGGDINVSSGSLGNNPSLTYTISNNQIYASGTGGQPPNGSVIVAAATPQGSATGTISGNTIGTTGITQSGGFDAILADAVGAGVHTVSITNNTIRRYKEAGIRLLGVSGTSFNIRATVKGNTITEPDSVAFAGIDAEVGADPSDVGTMCLDLGGSGSLANSVSNGDPGNFNDINIIQQFATSIALPGYLGSATDDSAVDSFEGGRNSGDGTPTVVASHDTTTADGNPAGSGFLGAANCA